MRSRIETAVSWLLVLFVVSMFLVFVIAAVDWIAYMDSERSNCIRDHQVCVDTTDGWKPYGEGR